MFRHPARQGAGQWSPSRILTDYRLPARPLEPQLSTGDRPPNPKLRPSPYRGASMAAGKVQRRLGSVDHTKERVLYSR